MSIRAEKLTTSIVIPQGVKITLNKRMLNVTGPLGMAYKSFRKIPVNIDVSDDKVVLNSVGSRKRDYAILNTSRSIIDRLCHGVVTGYTIKMKIVFAHFPITVKIKDDLVLIENFQGERAMRTARLIGNVKVTPKGDDVIITGYVLTDVTQTAANIAQATKVKNKDHRVFLDGIYRFEKTDTIES